MSVLQEMHQKRLQNLDVFVENGCEKYPHEFKVTKTSQDILLLGDDYFDETREVSMAGRIVLLRPMGKSCFLTFQDSSGRFQAFIQQNTVGENAMKLSKKLDIGDIIGVVGHIFKTQAGELTVRVESFTLLAKSFKPLPEKHHGLQDVELKYRNRHLDLICNEESRNLFKNKSIILNSIRQFLNERKYIEVETPILQPMYGGAAAKPFTTHHNELDADLFLRIAPELYLKKLLVGGLDRVFEIGRNFRNEGVSTRHNPEFTMLEFYTAYKDYRHGIAITKELLRSIYSNTVSFGDDFRDISPNERTLIELVDEFIKKRYLQYENIRCFGEMSWSWSTIPSYIDALKSMLSILELQDCNAETSEEIIMNIYEKHIEHTLEATFVIGFPKSISPLAKASKEDPNIAERFELIIDGIEIANGYSELNDPAEQLKSFESQEPIAGMKKDVDMSYIDALEYGMPPACGVGIGIDRLIMVLTGTKSIRDVILFPAMRSNKEEI